MDIPFCWQLYKDDGGYKLKAKVELNISKVI
jgi:hypothetical protein